MTLISDLGDHPVGVRERLAALLHDSFCEFAPAWLPTVADAREVVDDSLGVGKLSRVMVEAGEPVAWVVGTFQYSRVWELHPLCVAAPHRGRGLGSHLVKDLMRLVHERGALTLTVSTSDEMNRTSLFGADLYADPAGCIARLKLHHEHPVAFYLRLGFRVVGVIPDAEGPGMPSILLARSVAGAHG